MQAGMHESCPVENLNMNRHGHDLRSTEFDIRSERLSIWQADKRSRPLIADDLAHLQGKHCVYATPLISGINNRIDQEEHLTGEIADFKIDRQAGEMSDDLAVVFQISNAAHRRTAGILEHAPSPFVRCEIYAEELVAKLKNRNLITWFVFPHRPIGSF